MFVYVEKMKLLIVTLLIYANLAKVSYEDYVKPCNPMVFVDKLKHLDTKTSKMPVIVDTDIGGFPDDPTALAILHGLANLDQIEILAMVGSTRYEGIAMAMDVINTFFGRSNIPLGVTRDAQAYSDSQGSQNWTEYIRHHFPHQITSNADTEDSIVVLRKTLANASDYSVLIFQIGHFTNLANLLQSQPDGISPLSGVELVQRKVVEVVTMAGEFPFGTEWNIKKDASSARRFAMDWPTL